MSERAAFVRAIRENLADDAPRLIAADWFEEHGQETRAEFIRVQVEAACLSPYEQRLVELNGRATTLERRHERTWQPTLRDMATERVYRRGFVECAAVSADRFAANYPALFALEPLSEIVVAQPRSRLPQLTACQGLLQLEGLNFSNTGIGAAYCRTFFGSSYLHQLRKLDVSRNHLGSRGVRAIVNARLDCLTELVMTQNLRIIRQPNLFRTNGLRNLKKLDLSQNRFPWESLDSLPEASFWPTLEVLDLSSNPVAYHLPELFAGMRSVNLRELTLSDCDLLDAHFDQTFVPHRFAHLEKLTVASNQHLTSQLLRFLADERRFPALRQLEVILQDVRYYYRPQYQPEDIEAASMFAESKVMANLTSLTANPTEIWLEALANTNNAKKLEKLSLTRAVVGEDYLRRFVERAELPELREMTINVGYSRNTIALETLSGAE